MKKIYFASDFHLGTDLGTDLSRERERRICRWLDSIKHDAATIYLIGDIFDFWFEYKTVVPKGYVRLLGKLAELKDMGVEIAFFTGNHDMWMFRYFDEEMGIPVYKQPILKTHYGQQFFIAHGDGLGPDDYKYKLLKKIFANPLCQWLFQKIHPNIGIGIAKAWSSNSKKKNMAGLNSRFLGKDKEWLIAYAERKIKTLNVDYFVFGHRHLSIDYTLSNGRSRYINTGEWMQARSYAVFDGNDMKLLFFENEKGCIANQ